MADRHTQAGPSKTRLHLAAGIVALGALSAAGFAHAQSQPLPPEAAPRHEIERRQQQEIEAQRERAQHRPDVLAPEAAPDASGDLRLPTEDPCFLIARVQWEAPAPPAGLRRAAEAVQGRCVGVQGLQQFQKHLGELLIDAGLITTRVLVPEQSLADGTLTLRYMAGRIGVIRDEATPGWWRTALPTGPGGAVNQRDLDQALESIRRLAGQGDASIDLVPGTELGESDLQIKPGTGKRWHANVGADNAGMNTTGKNQINAGLTLDSPLFLYDQLSASWNSNADMGNGQAGARAASVNYSVPVGYWSVFAGASRSHYRQTVAGFDEPIVYGGTSKQIEAGVAVVPYRGAAYKGTASLKVLRKRANSTLNGIDIEVQRRDVAGYEFSYGHRHYVGRAALDIGGGVRGVVPSRSNNVGYVLGDPDWDGRTLILSGNAGLYLPFPLAGQQMAYQGVAQIQHAKTPLVPADFFTIGNRYAVRGFDGQMTLAAEHGWSLRNDVSLNLDGAGLAGQQLYTGLDVGRVSGPSAEYLASRTLVGAVAGLRGRLAMPYVTAAYDLSAGWPLKKPDVLKAQSMVVAATLMFEF